MWTQERHALGDERLNWLANLDPVARRYGIDCWHGSPTRPLDGFLTPQAAATELPNRPIGSWGLVGHTHDPALFLHDGVQPRGFMPQPDSPIVLPDDVTVLANPGAVVGGRTDPAGWWMELDTEARLVTWHRVRVPARTGGRVATLELAD
jgi:hypothetical protein